MARSGLSECVCMFDAAYTCSHVSEHAHTHTFLDSMHFAFAWQSIIFVIKKLCSKSICCISRWLHPMIIHQMEWMEKRPNVRVNCEWMQQFVLYAPRYDRVIRCRVRICFLFSIGFDEVFQRMHALVEVINVSMVRRDKRQWPTGVVGDIVIDHNRNSIHCVTLRCVRIGLISSLHVTYNHHEPFSSSVFGENGSNESAMCTLCTLHKLFLFHLRCAGYAFMGWLSCRDAEEYQTHTVHTSTS